MAEDLVVENFGGGLNLQGHPAHIGENQWSFCDGFMPRNGAAEQLPPLAAVNGDVSSVGADIIGFAQDAFTDANIIVGVERLSGLELFKFSAIGGIVQITRSGGTNDPRADAFDILTTAFLNSKQIFSGGMQNSLSVRSSLASYAGGATYDTIDPPAGEELRPQQIKSFGNYLVAAGVMRVSTSYNTETRRVAWSASGNELLWAPALSNDADDVLLDDVTGPIVGLVRLSNNLLGIVTRGEIHALSPTGRIPAFRRVPLSAEFGGGFPTDVGNLSRMRISGLVGETPGGACIVGQDNVYLFNGTQARGIAGPILDWFFSDTRRSSFDTTDIVRPICWHPTWGQILIPRLNDGVLNKYIMCYSPADDAWGMFDLDTQLPSVVQTRRMGVMKFEGPFRFVTHDDRQVYCELFSATGTPGWAGAFVDTKDFTVGSRYWEGARLILDLEGTSGTTVTVQQWGRDVMNPAVLSGDDWQSRRIAPSFTTVGNVTPTSPEIALRIRNKFVRFRFLCAGGRSRIRGFKLRQAKVGDR